MDTQEYNRILKKYNIPGKPSLIELKKILRKKIKNYHPDRYLSDPNYLKYQEATRDLLVDYDIVHNAVLGKSGNTIHNQPSSTAYNPVVTNEPKKNLDDLKKDASEAIEKLKKIYEDDVEFKKTLDLHATIFKNCQDREEFVKQNNRFKRDLLFKRKLKFRRILNKDSEEYGDDVKFFYNIYADYNSRLEMLDESDPSIALSELSRIKREYNTAKQIYLNNLSRANSSRKAQ